MSTLAALSPDSTSRDREIARLYEAGFSYAEIGRRFDLTRERVRQILMKAGEPAYYQALSAERRRLAEGAGPLFRARMTRAQVASRLAVSMNDLHGCIVHARRVVEEGRGEPWERELVAAIGDGRRERAERRRELLQSSSIMQTIAEQISASGYPLRAIADLTGVSYATVAELSHGAKYLPRPSTLERLATLIPGLRRLDLSLA
ncbi:MAG TPA: sigma factor-like helix-turn-helix DNA-binding protein [Planctomycetota bacterium]|nr:sigma factor-like helix-turn-helix DNA-binding protein [Planctomycetota bacterium]